MKFNGNLTTESTENELRFTVRKGFTVHGSRGRDTMSHQIQYSISFLPSFWNPKPKTQNSKLSVPPSAQCALWFLSELFPS